MKSLIPHNRRLVKRASAEQYLLISLMSFGVSVLGTRLFLELTGYPQLGNSELHIAHVLWGGLILFVASLLPLIYSNQWVLSVCAVLSGVGVGLFIDEVGKFITQSNDYFYPPAAPIIYAVFLLTVLVYLRVRKNKNADMDTRADLYRVLADLEEILDHDLDAEERAEIETQLEKIAAEAEHPDLEHLARSLLVCVRSQQLMIVPSKPGKLEYWRKTIFQKGRAIFDKIRLKWTLILGFGWMGITAIINLSVLILLSVHILRGQDVSGLITPSDIHSVGDLRWFIIRLGLEGVIGLTSIAATVFLLIGREERGIVYGVLGLIVSLAGVNLLVFYLDQFRAVFITLFQLILLLASLNYRRRFIPGSNNL